MHTLPSFSSFWWASLCALTIAGCSQGDLDVNPRPAGDGAYRYVLGHDPATGNPIIGGVHKVVVLTADRGKAEAIDSANQPSRLHPDLGKTEYGVYDRALDGGETDWDVFASSWWPQSKNGTAWRWQPGAAQDYNVHDDVDKLSPLEKIDKMMYPGQTQQVAEVEHCEYRDFVDNGEEDCEKIKRPALTVIGPATKWEMENQGTYQTYDPEYWWGHCNGWASYATAEPLGAPLRDVRVKHEGDEIIECEAGEEDCVLFKMADIEALMTELYFSDEATFSGRRCNTAPDEIEKDEFGRPTDPACRDLNPASLHTTVTGLFSRGARNLVTNEEDRRPAFVIDHNFDYEVWNFPLVKYEIRSSTDLTEAQAIEAVGATGSDYQFNSAATTFAQIHMTYWMVSDGVAANKLLLQAKQRNVPLQPVDLHYVLEMNDQGKILGGEWIQDPSSTWGENSKELHPDFMWMAIDPVGWGEGADDLGGNSDNPYVSYPIVQAILRCSNEPESCNDTPTDPNQPVSLCEDQCGAGPFTEDSKSCYCDAACVTYNDCCDGYAATCTDTGTDPDPDPDPTIACEHALCDTGVSLTDGCEDSATPGSCVEDICEVDAFCCNNSWDNQCVNEVSSICELSCS